MLMSMANTWRRLKREIFNSAYWSSIEERAFLLQVAGEELGENDKDWVEKVGEKKMAFFSVMIVHVGVGRLFVLFFTVKVIWLII